MQINREDKQLSEGRSDEAETLRSKRQEHKNKTGDPICYSTMTLFLHRSLLPNASECEITNAMRRNIHAPLRILRGRINGRLIDKRWQFAREFYRKYITINAASYN